MNADPSGCTFNGCGAAVEVPVHRLCNYHYAKLCRTGILSLVPARPVLDHIEALRALGWTVPQISQKSGVADTTVRGLLRRQPLKARRSTANPILAIPLSPTESRIGVDPCGTVRRLQALAALGWPRNIIARKARLQPGSIHNALWRGSVSHTIAHRITAVYDELQHTAGPSSRMAAIARNRGWQPPAAWDDIDTDPAPIRPQRQPDLVDEVALQRAAHTGDGSTLTDAEKSELLRRLLAKDVAKSEIARILRWSGHRINKEVAA